MSRVSQLFDLQQIDSGMDSRVARMRQIDQEMLDSPELLAARESLSEVRSALATRQGALKELTRHAEEVAARLKAQDKVLYGGTIKNPKELSQVQDEVAHLRERLKSLEDSALEAMLIVEEAEDVVSAHSEELTRIEKDWEHRRLGLQEEKDKLTEQAKVLQVKRQKAMTEVAWADLQAYERLRRSKGGVAVVSVPGALCAGCHVAVPVHVLRVARSSTEFVLCPSCGRILCPADDVKFKEFDHGLDNVAR